MLEVSPRTASDSGSIPRCSNPGQDQGAFGTGFIVAVLVPRIIRESFSGRLRQECLDSSWFLGLEDARAKIKSWRERYNREHPNSALGYLAPGEFAASNAWRTGPVATAKLSWGRPKPP